MKPRHLPLTLGVAAGGLLAAAFLPVAVASADEFTFTPDTTTYDPTFAEGFAPLYQQVWATESWNVNDLTSNVTFLDFLGGADLQTTFLGVTNDAFYVTSSEPGIPVGDLFDTTNFGLGFENVFTDVLSGPAAQMTDTLITPFGDFPL